MGSLTGSLAANCPLDDDSSMNYKPQCFSGLFIANEIGVYYWRGEIFTDYADNWQYNNWEQYQS